MLGEGEGVGQRVKGVRLEKMERIVDQLVRDPRHGPSVEPGISIVETAKARWVNREGVGENHGRDGENRRGEQEVAKKRSGGKTARPSRPRGGTNRTRGALRMALLSWSFTVHSTAIESKTGLGFKWLSSVGAFANGRAEEAAVEERFPLTWL